MDLVTAWPEGPNDYDAWLGLNNAERWAYVRRLEDAVLDLEDAVVELANGFGPPPRLVAASRRRELTE